MRKPRPLPQAGAIALQGIWDTGQVQPGQKVLINGAGGGSGMYAVQLAKLRGRGHRGGQPREAGVHALTWCGPRHRLHAGRRHQEWAQLRLDSRSRRASFDPCHKGSLAPGGRYLYVGGSAATLLQVLLIGPLLGRTEGKKLRLLAVRLGAERLGPMVALCQAGTIVTVIDRRYPLREVPEALRYLGEGNAKARSSPSSSSCWSRDSNPLASSVSRPTAEWFRHPTRSRPPSRVVAETWRAALAALQDNPAHALKEQHP